MNLPHKNVELKLFREGYEHIYSVDEVGSGCLAGPVVVCAVSISKLFYMRPHTKLRGLRESKLLTPSQREYFASELVREKDLVYSISFCHPKMIDKLNIYQATRQAMRHAIKKIQSPDSAKMIVLVDGKTLIPKLPYTQRAIVKGDQKIFGIACASILAKVYRDKMMRQYAKKYPGYGFEKHMGYATKYHQVQLMALGPCPIHRRSFRLDYD